MLLGLALVGCEASGEFDRPALERVEDQSESLANELLRFSVGVRDRAILILRSITGKRRIARKDRDYLVFADENGFEEVMAYYHLDAAIRHLESMGYRGRRAIFRKPLPVNVSATPVMSVAKTIDVAATPMRWRLMYLRIR